jgi:hypothetical protein
MSDELQNPNPAEEPSVLDYVKSLFRFGKGGRIQIPLFAEEEKESQPAEPISRQPADIPQPSAFRLPRIASQPAEFHPFDNAQDKPSFLEATLHPSKPTPFPWRSLLAILFALFGQNTFEPPPNGAPLGYAFYLAAFGLLGWAIFRGEWTLAPLAQSQEGTDPLTYRRVALLISVALGFWAFILFADNLFTTFNLLVWCAALAFFVAAFWLKDKSIGSILSRFSAVLKQDSWTISVSHWTLLLIAATTLVFFFRFYQMTGVPPEPFSDHAEKLLDVYDITQGQTHIFFTRNTGREAFQMYWTLLVAKLFGTGLSFLSLKLGTAILGFLTLPFIYLLGKEIGGPRVALFAFILTGIGYWPNVISRVGLRFPLYPLFVAPTLLFLIRGLRTRSRNDFLLSGIFLGIGLHGYSPFRFVPFVVLAAFVLYWLHAQSRGARSQLPVWFGLLGLASLVVFLPLLSYWAGHPAEYSSRALSRLTGTEQALPGPALEVFLSNVWNALKMFNFDDGQIWVLSVTGRPALDVVSGALFLLGVALVLVRYVRNRHWLDLFLLLSVPLLAMPSSLSLAFPNENPAINRAAAAYIPAFIVGAMALDGFLTSLGRGVMRSILVWVVTGILLYFSASQNYDLVFRQYYTSFRAGSWNTSDMGQVIEEFEYLYGTTDTAWVVPFPYWADTRLPAAWVGIPNRDMAMWRENMPATLELTGPKLFIVKANLEDPNGNDQASLDVLESLYPEGQLRMFDSEVPGHDFWIFLVPGQ